MAITRPLLATSLLLCSLLVIAYANDYSYDSSQNQAYGYVTKQQGEKNPDQPQSEKPDYVAKPAYQPHPEKKEKPDYSTQQPAHQSQPEKPEPVYQPQPEKPDYSTKPVYQSQPKQPDYGTKPDSYKLPQPVPVEEVEKPIYSTKFDSYKPNPQEDEKSDNYVTELPDFYPLKPEVVLPNIGVQGRVLCKSGPKHYPIEGALAKITCPSSDENGYEKPDLVCSGKTDANGYFLATFSPLGLIDQVTIKLTDCKAFLESSPLKTCNIPVDVNKGITGAPLFDFRVLHQNKMKLFTVGPFFFAEPNSIPNGY